MRFGGLGKVQPLITLWGQVGALPKNLRLEARSSQGLKVMNVLRVVALGGSTCGILRGLEAPGGPTSKQPVIPGGCISKEFKTFGRELPRAVTNALRIVALEGSICGIPRGLEAPGGPAPVIPGMCLPEDRKS